MKTFRNNNNTFRNNNNRRPSFRRNDRGFQRNDFDKKFNSDFSSGSNFQRSVPGRNNLNASKLNEKYNDLAREALSNDDKILAESYFQHADHFVRILSEQEVNRVSKTHVSSSSSSPSSDEPKKLSEVLKPTKFEDKKIIKPSKTD